MRQDSRHEARTTRSPALDYLVLLLRVLGITLALVLVSIGLLAVALYFLASSGWT